jgi:hypothetical protein
MALCHNCDDTRIEYIGNGTQEDYTFPFEYNERNDVAVAYWNADYQVWEPITTGWVFLNDTTLRFDTAPEVNQKLIIYRCTDLSPLPAEFYPGTAIKAQDLNDNFFVLKSAIEEARCAISRQDEKAEEKYWNKVTYDEVATGVEPDIGETVYSTDRWVCTDDAVASTGAICEYVAQELAEEIVTEADVQDGRWTQNTSPLDTDDKVPSTAAITERLDPYFQDYVPSDTPRWRMPGKVWFDNDRVETKFWDQANQTWVTSGVAGPPGPTGPKGTYQTIVSDTAPTQRTDSSALQNGDVWFNSTNAELFVWYDDGQPDSILGKQWVQAVGGAKGVQGEQGGQGPIGPVGPPQNVIVSDTAPTQDENGDPVEEGDLWWNSYDGNLYIYYVDNTGPQWVSCTKSAAGGGQGVVYEFNAPLYELNNIVNFDINLLNTIP